MSADYLSSLNDSQKAAVLYNDGPALVIAGAGSGKTRVLVYKLLHLIRSGYDPRKLMALTFTNKASREMKERVAVEIGRDAYKMQMGTFHSVFSRILRENADRLGYTSDFSIYDTNDTKSLLRHVMKRMNIDDKVYRINAVQHRISMAKNQLISPESYAANKELARYDIDCRMPRMSEIYAHYAVSCKQNNAMDFDDLLFKVNILFRDYPDVLKEYRDRIDYLLIDEYQDTNFAQYLIARQLMGEKGRVFVVGDDAQSIYSFRGAKLENILGFSQSFPGSKLFKLEENYRSTQCIVNAANSLIAHNEGRIPKQVYSMNQAGEPIRLVGCLSGYLEAYTVAEAVMERRLQEHCAYSDFAILYRTNAQSRPFEEALRKHNIPFRIYGGLSFYSRKEVKDVLAYFRLIVNPNDDEALRRIINYPKRGIGDTTITRLNEIAHRTSSSLWSVLSDPATFLADFNAATQRRLTDFADLLAQLREAEYDSLYEQAADIIKCSGISADIFSDKSVEGISRQENLKELLNAIEEYAATYVEENGRKATLATFLSEVVLLTDQDTGQEDSQFLTLMTVHAAKGLEFKHVFIVGMEENLFPMIMNANEQGLEEERRLFYVAITRAKETCHISYAAERSRNGRTERSRPSRFLREIDAAYIQSRVPHEMLTESNDGDHLPTRFGRSDSFDTIAQPIPSRRKLVHISSTPVHQENAHHHQIGDLCVGDTVSHARFGIGVILQLEGEGDNAKADVAFSQVGNKRLLLRFAKLSKLESDPSR
ncbi:ATP-dependent helicase [Porphyromonas loveana]|uniref:ATP-dependent helicase n=1 Tax=Porphyromonas loveana TaxID=1884669 RepID=UPI0035A039ED